MFIHDGFNVTLALCDRSFKRLNTRLSNAIFQNVKHVLVALFTAVLSISLKAAGMALAAYAARSRRFGKTQEQIDAH